MPHTFWCDYATVGTDNITYRFVKMSTSTDFADYYLEIGFKEGSGYLDPGAFTEVVVRFLRPDWSTYDQSNDYTFNVVDTSYVEWDKMAVYLNGAHIWGKAPD